MGQYVGAQGRAMVAKNAKILWPHLHKTQIQSEKIFFRSQLEDLLNP